MNFFKMILLSGLGLCSTGWAGTVTIPNSFSSGSATSASQMNANFTAVKTAVDDNNTRIAALEAGTRPVFQGFSSSTSNGGAGLIAMQQACSASFSASKVCTSTEFANSVYNSNASNVSGKAWILPDTVALANAYNQNNADYTFAVDRTLGMRPTTPADFSCGGWADTASNVYGSTVDNLGKFSQSACNSVQAVACCK